MNKVTTIAICLLVIAFYSCSKKNPTPAVSLTDTAYNGSYIELTIDGNYYKARNTIVAKSTTVVTVSVYQLGGQDTLLGINIGAAYGVKGLIGEAIVMRGKGVGQYTMHTNTGLESKIYIYGKSPSYTCDSGTANITHNDALYVEGDLQMYMPQAVTPVTGHFKIFR